jgi:hypothetical protein
VRRALPLALRCAGLLVAFAAGAAGFLWFGNRRAGRAQERLDASISAS